MTKASKMEIYEEIELRYKISDKLEKTMILDEFCKICGYNRKYAIRKLSIILSPRPKVCGKKIGRPKIYYSEAIEAYILTVWKTTNLICSKRLKIPVQEWTEFYKENKKEDKLTEEDKKLLRKISPSTIDRLLASHRNRYKARVINNKTRVNNKKPNLLLILQNEKCTSELVDCNSNCNLYPSRSKLLFAPFYVSILIF